MTREENRNILIERSKLLKIIAKETGESVNELLIQSYTKGEHKEFNTLKSWNKKGYTVKKGEKAFLIWGKPKKNEDKEETPTETTEEDIIKGKYWPIAYLFSNAQVNKI
jgi:hypothetical protein